MGFSDIDYNRITTVLQKYTDPVSSICFMQPAKKLELSAYARAF